MYRMNDYGRYGLVVTNWASRQDWTMTVTEVTVTKSEWGLEEWAVREWSTVKGWAGSVHWGSEWGGVLIMHWHNGSGNGLGAVTTVVEIGGSWVLLHIHTRLVGGDRGTEAVNVGDVVHSSDATICITKTVGAGLHTMTAGFLAEGTTGGVGFVVAKGVVAQAILRSRLSRGTSVDQTAVWQSGGSGDTGEHDEELHGLIGIWLVFETLKLCLDHLECFDAPTSTLCSLIYLANLSFSLQGSTRE